MLVMGFNQKIYYQHGFHGCEEKRSEGVRTGKM